MDKSHADHGAVDLQDDTDPPVDQDAADQFAVQDSIDHHDVQAVAVEHLAAEGKNPVDQVAVAAPVAEELEHAVQVAVVEDLVAVAVGVTQAEAGLFAAQCIVELEPGSDG